MYKMPFLSPNQQCQITERIFITFIFFNVTPSLLCVTVMCKEVNFSDDVSMDSLHDSTKDCVTAGFDTMI